MTRALKPIVRILSPVYKSTLKILVNHLASTLGPDKTFPGLTSLLSPLEDLHNSLTEVN